MKVWSTKYCLTCGITEHEIEDGIDGSVIVIPRTDKMDALYLHGEGKDWHKSVASAVLRATEVKVKKLLSLDKQIKKIRLIDFDS